MPLLPTENNGAPRREPAQTAAVRSTELSSQERTNVVDKPRDAAAGIKLDVNSQDLKEPARLVSISPAVTIGSAPAARDVTPARESGPKDVNYYRERAVSAYHNGDLYIALANFDLAIQKDPACSDCYVDRGIVLHRMGDLKGAISDVAEARRIDALNRKKTLSDATVR